MDEPAFARMWEFGGRWYARLDAPAFIEVTGVTRERCLEEVRKITGDDVTLTVEVVPSLAGVSECAEIMGWDKRRVITYLNRGSFPEPLTALASGQDGLRDLAQIIGDAPSHLLPGAWLLLEHGWDQGAAVRALLALAGFQQTSTAADLEHRDRVSLGRVPC